MSRSVSAQTLIVVVLVSAIAGSAAGFAFSVVLLKAGPIGSAGPIGQEGPRGLRGDSKGVEAKAIVLAIQENPAAVAAAIQGNLNPSLSDIQLKAEAAKRAADDTQSTVRRLETQFNSLCSSLSAAAARTGQALRC